MKRLSALLVILSLLLVIFGAPVYEVLGGNWPTAGMQGDFTLDSVLEGGAAEEIEQALDRSAVLPDTIRPRYNELMFLALGESSSRVLVGKDDWLFLASRIVDRPADALEKLPDRCRRLAALVGWLESHGTHVLFEFIPRKQSLYPGQLPDDLKPPFVSYYPQLVAAMREAGLHVVDLSHALGPADGVFFLTNDDHWNHKGSFRSATAVVEQIKKLYPEGDYPGRPIDAEIRSAEPYRYAGNLVRMLGFQEQGFMHDRFSVDRTRIVSYVPGDIRPLHGSKQAEPIVVLGTSFSAGFQTASLVLGMLGRVVENRAKKGLAGGYRMVDLCREILLGERDFPEVLVWEFPEDFMVQTADYFLQPVDSIVEVADGYPYSARPLPVKRRLMKGIRVSEEDETGLSGTVFTRQAELTYILDQPVPGDGSAVLAFPLLVSGRGTQKTSWDTSIQGAKGGERLTLLNNSEYPHLILVGLKTADGKPVRRIRIQPFNVFARFHIGPPELWTSEAP